MSSILADSDSLQSFVVDHYVSESALNLIGESDHETTRPVPEVERSAEHQPYIRTPRGTRSSISQGPTRYVMNWPDDEAQDNCYRTYNEKLSRDDDSVASSSSFLHRVKTIGTSIKSIMSMKSLSAIGRSRSNTGTSSRFRSSTFSGSDPRTSIDGSILGLPFPYSDSQMKSGITRHRIIEEIITTEMSYLTMLRNLSQGIGFTLISPTGTHQAINSLITLHQRLLESLLRRNTRPISIPNIAIMDKAHPPVRDGSILNPLAAKTRRARADSQVRQVMALPSEAEEVATILEKHFVEFRTYKDYFMTFPFVQAELDVLRQSKETWDAYERGVEALVRVVQPLNQKEKTAKQGFTINDLLIQPVQRICKYQLFLDSLMKCTPSDQYPNEYEALHQASEEVKAAIREVNSFQPDSVAVERAKRTMELQAKLEFPCFTEQRNVYRVYGAMKLCGVLHVVYQTGEKVTGSYMLCALFESHMLFATRSSEPNKFDVKAVISLRQAKLEGKTNGIGLHCSGAPYTWKLVFGSKAEVFELVLSACSEKEETEWISHLERHINASEEAEPEVPGSPFEESLVYLSIEPLQAALIDGRLLSVARRTSIHGPLVVVPNFNGLRIYIKGTAASPVAPLPIAPPINRTQSLQNPRREIIVGAKRQKRIKIEKRLAGIWSHDILPYPGMPPESFVRASTDALMGTFSSLPAFARRASSIGSKKRKKSERFTLARDEYDKEEDGNPIDNATIQPPAMDAYPDEAADKFDVNGELGRVPSSQRRGLMALRKRRSNVLKHAASEAEKQSPPKVDRPSLRKRLSVALFNRVTSPGKSRRFNSVEA